MSLTTLPATQVIQRLHEFDTVIDARSEGEYEEDHLPGAVNWPTLNNDERRDIGTLYKQVNAFEAKKRGAAIAARNIATHIEREVIDKPKDWKPLAYCWPRSDLEARIHLPLSVHFKNLSPFFTIAPEEQVNLFKVHSFASEAGWSDKFFGESFL